MGKAAEVLEERQAKRRGPTPKVEYHAPARGRRNAPTEAVLRRTEEYLKDHDLICDHVFPTNPGLAEYLQIPLTQIEKWLDRADESDNCGKFADLFERLKDKRHHYLQHEGVQNYASNAITKLVLEHEYGYVTKTESKTVITGDVKVDLNITPADASKRYRQFMTGKK